MSVSDYVSGLARQAAAALAHRPKVAAGAKVEAEEPEAPEGGEVDPEDIPEEHRDNPDDVGEVAASGPADPAGVAEFCARNGAPHLAGPLIREGASWAEVKSRVGAVEAIRALVQDGHAIAPDVIPLARADAFIATGASVEDARSTVWAALVDGQSPEIRGAIAADTGIETPGERAKRGWERAADQVNARIDAMSGYSAASGRQQGV